MGDHCFVIDNLAFERNNQFLFAQINCTLQAGEVLQIRGANGSGKSTLLRILAGLIEPTNGSIVTQPLHYLGHQNAVKQNLTVYENLKLYSALSGIKIQHLEINAIVKKIGLNHVTHRKACYLSAGQVRRLSLARLLLNPVPLWLLDEPTTALDTEGQQLLTDLLNQQAANGGMAIVATHQNLLLTHPLKTIHLGEQYAK